MTAIKLPLKVSTALSGNIGLHEQGRTLAIATMNFVAPKEELREKAEQIVTAVNSHKDIVGLLTALLVITKRRNREATQDRLVRDLEYIHNEIEAALEKAKGGGLDVENYKTRHNNNNC
jgi:hypothetical protein